MVSPIRPDATEVAVVFGGDEAVEVVPRAFVEIRVGRGDALRLTLSQ